MCSNCGSLFTSILTQGTVLCVNFIANASLSQLITGSHTEPSPV